MPEIAFKHICKTYVDGTEAVIDLDLTIADREFFCVLGPSGCGKSSTLRMLAGLEPITSGDLVLDGERINNMPPQTRDMAMVFENYALYPHLRVFENIAMPLKARRRPRAPARLSCRPIEARCRERACQRVATIAGVKRQRGGKT